MSKNMGGGADGFFENVVLMSLDLLTKSGFSVPILVEREHVCH